MNCSRIAGGVFGAFLLAALVPLAAQEYPSIEEFVINGEPCVDPVTHETGLLVLTPDDALAISWRIRNASSASITPNIGSVDPVSGSRTVSLRELGLGEGNHFFRLYAAGTVNGQVSTTEASILVRVFYPPKIVRFAASPETVTAGEPITVSWELRDFERATLDSGGQVPPGQSAGPTVITPQNAAGSLKVDSRYSNGEFSLTVRGKDTSLIYGHLSVAIVRPPEIALFKVAKPFFTPYELNGVIIDAEVGPGEAVAFQYGFKGDVARAELRDGQGARLAELSVPPPSDVGIPVSTVEVHPEQTALYYITAWNEAGKSVDGPNLNVVVVSPPAIVSFECDHVNGIVGKDEPFELRWAIRDARSAAINGDAVDHGFGNGRRQTFSTSASREYRLSAENRSGTDSRSLMVRVVPEIKSFAADPPGGVPPGDRVLLSWDVDPPGESGALEATSALDGVEKTEVTRLADAGPGRAEVRPERTTAYALKIAGPSPSTSPQKLLTVLVLLPRIESFFSSALGDGRFKLGWFARDARAVEIEPGAGSFGPKGETIVGPLSEDTEYTLRATAGTASDSRTIMVGVKPSIELFAADRPEVPLAGSVTLAWKVRGAKELVLLANSRDPKSLPDLKEGTETVSGVAATTRFTLRASSAGGTAEAWADVKAVPRPVIDSFTCNFGDLVVLKDTGFLLRWRVSNAASLDLNGEAVPAPNGEKEFRIARTTSFLLRAANIAGTAEAALTVRVLPRILSFDAFPATIEAGGKARLSWEIDPEAESARIEDKAGNVVLGNAAPGKGELEVNPAETTTFRLVAAPRDVGAECTVTVNPKSGTGAIRPPRIARVPKLSLGVLRPLGALLPGEYVRIQPKEVLEGEETVLRWLIRDASRASLTRKGITTSLALPAGERTFKPFCEFSGPGTCEESIKVSGTRKNGRKFEVVLTIRVRRR